MDRSLDLVSVDVRGVIDNPLARILLIVSMVWVARRFGKLLIARLIHRAMRAEHFASERDRKLREDTLVNIIAASLRVLLWIVASIMILGELGLDITPLLAGASVLGLAIGFGAQTLVRDFLSGIFIILENQYRIGDIIKIGDVVGTVEGLTMRTTVVRDWDGNLHHLPNSSITGVSNMSMGYANINIDLNVSVDADLDKVEKIVNEVGQELAEDEAWKGFVIEPPVFERVEAFTGSAMTIKVLGKVKPAKQWQVAGELRRRLKAALDKAKVKLA